MALPPNSTPFGMVKGKGAPAKADDKSKTPAKNKAKAPAKGKVKAPAKGNPFAKKGK
jgi:hypothetical protein